MSGGGVGRSSRRSSINPDDDNDPPMLIPPNYLHMNDDDDDDYDDKSFSSRLLSRDETHHHHSSLPIYYGESSVAVPFTWESEPGTPKRSFFNPDLPLPPLTPPPSYYSTTPHVNVRHKSFSSSFSSAPTRRLPRQQLVTDKHYSPKSNRRFLRLLMGFLKRRKYPSPPPPSSLSPAAATSSLESSADEEYSSSSGPLDESLLVDQKMASLGGSSAGLGPGPGSGSSPTSTLCFGGSSRRRRGARLGWL